jgi:hypothetical protein
MSRRIFSGMLSIALSCLVLAAAASAAVPTIQIARSVNDLPEALRPFGRAGDILVSDGTYAALVAGSSRSLRSDLNIALADPHGQIMAFAPAGASGRLLTLVGSPTLRAAERAASIRILSVNPEGQIVVMRAAASIDGMGGFEVTTRYEFDFDAGRIGISSEVRNTGPKEVSGLSFSLGANFIQSLNFSPYNARLFPNLNFRVYQRPDHVLGWLNPNPVETRDRPLPGLLRPGQSYLLNYSLLAGTDISDVLDRLYQLAGIKADRQTIELRIAGTPEGTPPGLGPGFEKVEALVREPATGAIFYRAFLNRPASLSVPLPEGTYSVRIRAFPAVRERTFRRGANDQKGQRTAWSIDVPALGTMTVRLRDSKGATVLGKISFIGLAPSESPYFTPEDPVLSGRGWETMKNSVYPGKEGKTIRLPAGTYLAVAARGPAYTQQTRVLEVLAGENPDANFVVDKVVDTPGLISVDTHMHTQFSDGQVKIAERLLGVVAEGIDVAVSTDHNYITDYRPEVERLGLADELAVIVGDEVTGRGGNIHFNSYPVTARPGEPGNGAISVQDSTPGLLFDMARKNDPTALIQVNHPRSRGLGYFLTYNLDPKAAAAADAPFVMNFDVMEAMNGALLDGANRATIEDWFHFLNRGYPIRVVGSSDAHSQDGGEPGYSRTYVLYGGAKGPRLDIPAVMRAIKEGRSFVSNGPIVTARFNGKSTYGDTLTSKDGRVSVELEVKGAPWIDVAEISLVVNGERQAPIPVGGRDGPGAGTLKYQGRTELKLERDAWIAVEVRGRRTLFPTVQQRSSNGRIEEAAVPYALTNPVFVDIGGDGKITPVWPEKIAIR